MFDNKKYDKCEQILTYSHDELLTSINKKINCENLSDYLRKHIKYIPTLNTHAYGLDRKKEYHPNPDWWIYRTMAFSGQSTARSKQIGEYYALISNNLTFDKVCGQYKDLVNIKSISKQTKKEKKFLEYYFAFNTKNELKNFWDYIHTDFVNIILYMYKKSLDIVNVPIKYIPWQDFSINWDDYKLFKKYNFTKEEVKHIYNILPNYYNIKRINLNDY